MFDAAAPSDTIDGRKISIPFCRCLWCLVAHTFVKLMKRLLAHTHERHDRTRQMIENNITFFFSPHFPRHEISYSSRLFSRHVKIAIAIRNRWCICTERSQIDSIFRKRHRLVYLTQKTRSHCARVWPNVVFGGCSFCLSLTKIIFCSHVCNMNSSVWFSRTHSSMLRCHNTC